MTKSRPLPFTDWKAKLIAEMEPGEIIQTRRPIKRRIASPAYGRAYPGHRWFISAHPGGGWYAVDNPNGPPPEFKFTDSGFNCPYGIPGDTIWVREAYRFDEYYDDCKPSQIPPTEPVNDHTTDIRKTPIHFEADGNPPNWTGKKRPGMFLPKIFSRSLLTIVEVRVERVQEIIERGRFKDLLDEGWLVQSSKPITKGTAGEDARAWFENIWNGFYKDTDYAWELNPWVWVLSLRKEKADD